MVLQAAKRRERSKKEGTVSRIGAEAVLRRANGVRPLGTLG